MNRGLMKTTGLYALTLAAGLALSASANAADLGGNCCADLEERVAELEATAARKGTRVLSLTVWGSVNKTILGWDDGVQSNTFLGVDNINYATRFGFRGEGKINADFKAGYSIMLDITTGASSALVSQLREEAPASCTVNPAAFSCGANQWSNDHGIRMRDANWWLEHNRLGRLTMGRLTDTGPQGTIDLGGIGNVASGSQSLAGGSFLFRDSVTGSFGNVNGTTGIVAAKTGLDLASAAPPNINIASVTDNLADYANRMDGLRWDSPTWNGFVLGASIGEATKVERRNNLLGSTDNSTGAGPLGSQYAINLRYAGEFNGVRIAAAIGYEVSKAEETMASTNFDRPASKNFGYSLSAMHVPTGLFAQGHWLEFTRGNNDTTSDKATNWLIQAGLARNFFGIGNTALYGEYSKVENGLNTFAVQSAATPLLSSDYKMWGLGVTQNIDAASMQLYAGYRNHELSGTDGAGTALTAKDIGIWMAGARINF